MIWQIARKEFHDNWISHKIILAFVFSYAEPTVGERLRSALAPLVILLLFTTLFLVAGYVTFLRSDVK